MKNEEIPTSEHMLNLLVMELLEQEAENGSDDIKEVLTRSQANMRPFHSVAGCMVIMADGTAYEIKVEKSDRYQL